MLIIGIIMIVVSLILYTSCNPINETKIRDVDTREQPVKNKTVEIYDNGVMYESTAHDGKMLCTTWCVFSPRQGTKCFGQCIPSSIRNTK